LETVAFPFGGEKKTDASFLARKAETVIESARQLSRWCDIYKAEFPGHFGQESDDQLLDNLRALNAASERPWVLLSAGVDYPDYYKQVQMAMSTGASGVLGGRAFWKEYFLQDGEAARSQFAATHESQEAETATTLIEAHRSSRLAERPERGQVERNCPLGLGFDAREPGRPLPRAAFDPRRAEPAQAAGRRGCGAAEHTQARFGL
jgi:tagatose-1,6-bisphosphate aldolase